MSFYIISGIERNPGWFRKTRLSLIIFFENVDKFYLKNHEREKIDKFQSVVIIEKSNVKLELNSLSMKKSDIIVNSSLKFVFN